MIKSLMLTGMLLIASSAAIAGPSCHKTGSVCSDTTPSKMISGVAVTLAQVGGCWNYTDTYDCLKPDSVNYCAALSQLPGCSQTSSTCAVMDTQFGTGCMQWTNTYQCGGGLATPANTTILNTSYTIATNTLNTTACASYANNPTCSLASHTCVDTTPSKVINGLTVTLAQVDGCWNYADSYSCVGPMQSNCAPLIAKGCTFGTSTPVNYGQGGVVTLTADSYNCPGAPGATSSVMNCGQQQFCTGGNCMSTGHAPNTALGSAAAALELVREAGNYLDPKTLQVFAGESATCRDKLGGVGNCCALDMQSAGTSNASAMGFAVQVGEKQVLQYGTRYVFDSLMSGASYVEAGISSALGMGGAAAGTAADAAAAADASAAAATASASTAAAAGAGADAGGAAVDAGGTAMGAIGAAAPYIAAAIAIYEELSSCTSQEKTIAMQRGQNLCRYVTTFCDAGAALGCTETKQTFCCFNSLLARIVNDAGGPQMGRSAADCTGFTLAQFARLDLSKVDFSPFIAQIMANVAMPDQAGLNTDNSAIIAKKLNNYYTTGKQ